HCQPVRPTRSCVYLKSMQTKKGLKPPREYPSSLNPFERPGSTGVHPCRESSGQLGFDLLHDAAKGSRIVHGQIGQNLAVDFDRSLLQTVGELAVRQAACASTGIDTGNPQLTEDALLGTAITVGILPSLHHRLFGDAEDVTATAAETFGQSQYFFVSGASRDTTFDARH